MTFKHTDTIAVLNKEQTRMMVAAPDLYACVFSLLRNFPELGTDEELNGGDVIDWLNDQLPYWKAALTRANPKWEKEV